MLPKVIDLFSGCGGLALGFEKAGFEITGGIEIVPEACQTVSYNLDFRYGREQTHICGDITKMDTDGFKTRFGDEGCVVIGGPPCQAYSIAGIAKLRSLGDDRINTKDARGFLYQDYLRFVFDLDAKAAVMENVPEAVNYGGENIPDKVCTIMNAHGYNAFWTILNAADYGVPQIRERVVVLAVKKEYGHCVPLPIPTHKRKDRLQTVNQKRFDYFSRSEYFREPQSPAESSQLWITVGDALSDLPALFPTPWTKYRLPKLDEEQEYKTEPQNAYQKLMREWYGAESFGSTANAFRNNKRDFEIFARMQQGDDYRNASRIADELFETEASMRGFKPGSPEYLALKKKMVPVYDRENFETKWVKLDENQPSHTIIAHLSKDTYSHIHPIEPRGISVREAARLQSFPDDFFFDCSMGDAYKQIGNAVPPLLAYAVAKSVRNALGE